MKKLLFILLLAATVAHAETYKWTDSGGTVHFSESLGEIPAAFRESARPLEMGEVQNGIGSPGNVPAPALSESGQGAVNKSNAPSQVEGMKERMMNDEGIMTLILALQEDPEMRALLNDPIMMSAIQAGDIGTLMNNPVFLKILNNPKVREIEKRVNSQGTGTK